MAMRMARSPGTRLCAAALVLGPFPPYRDWGSVRRPAGRDGATRQAGGEPGVMPHFAVVGETTDRAGA